MKLRQIDGQEFRSLVGQGKALAVEFGAEWCSSCKALEPLLYELSLEYGKVDFAKVDVDKEPELANQFGIRSLPTLILFQNGIPVEQSIGYRPRNQVRDLLARLAP